METLVANVPSKELDFVPAGTSFIDVTLTGDSISLVKWLFLPFASMSDHPLIFFEVRGDPCRPSQSTLLRSKIPNIAKIDRDIFLNSLKERLTAPRPVSFSNTISIEREIETMVDTIVSCALKSSKPSIAVKPGRNMPWLSPLMCTQRTRTHAAHCRWTALNTIEYRIAYQKL